MALPPVRRRPSGALSAARGLGDAPFGMMLWPSGGVRYAAAVKKMA
jgi:hypothetical protein